MLQIVIKIVYIYIKACTGVQLYQRVNDIVNSYLPDVTANANNLITAFIMSYLNANGIHCLNI